MRNVSRKCDKMPTPGGQSRGERGTGMKYIVIARYMLMDSDQWITIQKEFADMEHAEYFAQDMYKSYAREITVLIYELKKSYN